MASLAAYSSQSCNQSDQVITEVLEECMKEIQSAKKRMSGTSELTVKSDNYNLFFFGNQVLTNGVLGSHLELWPLHWSLTCSKSITNVLDLILGSTGIRNLSFEVRRRTTEELKSWVSYGMERSLLCVGQFLPYQDLLWMLEVNSSDSQYSTQHQISLIGNILYQWHYTLSMTKVQFHTIEAEICGASVFYQVCIISLIHHLKLLC